MVWKSNFFFLFLRHFVSNNSNWTFHYHIEATRRSRLLSYMRWMSCRKSHRGSFWWCTDPAYRPLERRRTEKRQSHLLEKCRRDFSRITTIGRQHVRRTHYCIKWTLCRSSNGNSQMFVFDIVICEWRRDCKENPQKKTGFNWCCQRNGFVCVRALE